MIQYFRGIEMFRLWFWINLLFWNLINNAEWLSQKCASLACMFSCCFIKAILYGFPNFHGNLKMFFIVSFLYEDWVLNFDP